MKRRDTCEWAEDGGGIYDTDCGHKFETTTGTVTENDFHFCPFCGGKIELVEEEA